MATAPECITRFEREGVFAASPERIGRALRQRAPGSWPASPLGGGGASPHVTPVHLASFMIAQVGLVPSGAANALAEMDALTALNELPMLHYDKHHMIPHGGVEHGFNPPAPLLREVIETAIDAAADPAWRGALKDWTLIMCATDPPWAELISRHGDYQYVARFKRIGGIRPPRDEHVECVVRIPRRVLMICGELWADSKAKLATKDENTAALAGATASSTAPTARKRQAPNSSEASVRVRAPATSGESHAQRRRRPAPGHAPGAA